MFLFNKIVIISRRLASSLLKEESNSEFENSDLFSKKDKLYILNQLTDPSLIKERTKLKKQINKQADLEKVKNKITIPVKKLYWKYTVAASIVILLTTVYFFRASFFSENKDINTTIVENKIEIGKDKAILTLADGTNVSLEKGKSYQKNNISSDGEELVYNSAQITKPEIAYNYLTIPRGGQFFIKLSDGTKVWLNSDSKLKYPVTFVKNQTRKVELVYGEAYFNVSPSINHNGARFLVVNKNQEIEVLGTEFNIKSYKDDFNTATTLVEGKVTLNYEGKKQHLIPNQQSYLDYKTNTLTLKKVDVYNEISWKEGVFSFENKPLKDIMKVLARWYDMRVTFDNKNSQNIEFNGVLDKNQSIEEVLNIIKNFKVINNYIIKNKEVIIK
ncbi:hypothetical protein BW723_06365 [Polaribacter reichenbachii]|uniref:Anti-sigma factor n=1 Tax=Polaribacter reichenbachii TaxID=996801 RepID=A0A1B8U626_9FLAO|nr:FecR family protein [Polaribacter reichenbachii]APZ45937.1 hypothetical protein BW723_06365 [Polaribacter reichenbachii]AUC19799.1 hypothetical protein BTO17_14385 [Polaribacter reichenbachii]OBY67346.1 hypothetical protein LPB301_03125 [Polaribacter reichenbachii]